MKRVLAAFALGLSFLLYQAPLATASDVLPEVQVYTFQIDGANLVDLLAIPETAALAHQGGAGLAVETDDPSLGPILRRQGKAIGTVLGDFADPNTTYVPGPGSGGASNPGANADLVVYGVDPLALSQGLGVSRAQALRLAGGDIRDILEGSKAQQVLAIVTGSPETGAPVIVAEGDPQTLLQGGAPRTISSDSTHRRGIVTGSDYEASVLNFLGVPQPADLAGSPIRVVSGEPPVGLKERHLAQRRMYVPVGIGACAAVGVFALLLFASVLWRRRFPRFARWVGPWAALATPVLGAAMFRAGQLPTLSYATAIPFLVLVTLVLTAVFLWFRRFSVLGPAVALGVFLLAGLGLQGLMGWPAALATLIGGTALDGVRFFGMPNVIIGLLLGGALYVAAAISPYRGFVLLVAAGLFAGFPSLGANIGGAIALFSAAGMWLAFGEGRPVRWRGIGLATLVTVAGTTVVLAVHRFLAEAPTHATRFVEAAETNPLGAAGKLGDRLLVGWNQLTHQPSGIVPVLVLIVMAVLVLRPRGVIAEGFALRPQWGRAMAVLAVAGIVAYLANDTGVSASGLAAAMLLDGALYVPLAAIPGKMER